LDEIFFVILDLPDHHASDNRISPHCAARRIIPEKMEIIRRGENGISHLESGISRLEKMLKKRIKIPDTAIAAIGIFTCIILIFS
jgi:hypothetical protein